MRIAVTGGAGFLGARIVEQLLGREGDSPVVADEVRVLDVLPWSGAPDPRVDARLLDVRNAAAVTDALEGVDAVLHCAAIIDWGRLPEESLFDVNEVGTRHVVDACRTHGVGALVYTSTEDVVYGGNTIAGGDESMPYPVRYANAYCASKALAEQIVIGASSDTLRTCAVRPLGIFGEADPYHCSRTLAAARAGELVARMGDGSALFSHAYVGNVAHGHLCALANLLGEGSARGQVYFVGDDNPPENFFDFMGRFIEGLDLPFPPRSRTVPFRVAYLGAVVTTGVAGVLRPFTGWMPTVTGDTVKMLCEDFWFDDGRARAELGYTPLYTPDEAMARTVAWFRENGPVARSFDS